MPLGHGDNAFSLGQGVRRIPALVGADVPKRGQADSGAQRNQRIAGVIQMENDCDPIGTNIRQHAAEAS